MHPLCTLSLEEENELNLLSEVKKDCERLEYLSLSIRIMLESNISLMNSISYKYLTHYYRCWLNNPTASVVYKNNNFASNENMRISKTHRISHPYKKC